MSNDVAGTIPRVEGAGGSPSYWISMSWVRRSLRCLEDLGKIVESTLKAVEMANPGSMPLEPLSYMSSGPKAVLGALRVGKLFKNTKKLLSAPEGVKKFRALVSLMVNMDAVLDSVATVCQAVRAAVGPSARKAVAWIPFVAIVTFIADALSLALSAYSAYRARSLFSKTNAASEEFFKATTDEERAAVIKKILKILTDEGIKPLKRYLKLSRKYFHRLERRNPNDRDRAAISDLEDQIKALKEHVEGKKFDEQDETFVRLLGEKPLFSFYTHLDSAMVAIASIGKSIASIGESIAVVGRPTLRWLSLLNILGFVSSFLSLGISIYSVRGARALLKGFDDAMEKYLKAEAAIVKAETEGDGAEAAKQKAVQLEALKEALSVIDTEGIVPLRTHLLISKKAEKTLGEKVSSLRGHIYKGEVHKEDKDLMKLLAGRARTSYNLEVANVAADVATLAGEIILITPVPVIGQVVGFSVLAAAGAVSLGALGTRIFFIRKDPFDDASQNRMMRTLSSLSKGIRSLSLRLSAKGAQPPLSQPA